MPKFFYTARDNTGRKITGSEETSDQDELIGRLQARDLTVINILSELKEGSAGSAEGQTKKKLRFRRYGIRNSDLMLFCRQLATLLNAGVIILRSLDIVSTQVVSRKFYAVIKELQRGMEQGLSLHEAMAKHPRVFSELWVNLVESGEASGNLAVVLERLASYLERVASFKAKVISALIYPAILFLAGTFALLFLSIKIIPTFAELFKGFNVELPYLTLILLKVSNFIRMYVLYIFGLAIALIIAFKMYVKTPDGRRTYENIKFKMPIFGDFFRALIIERFSSNMATLIESGIPILYSLEITEHSVSNAVVGDIINRVKEEVRQGKSLSEPLQKSGFFDSMVLSMVNVGEEIGELSQMFKRINTYYAEYVETFLGRFTAIFEPIMLIFMGLVIGVIFIGMFLPIFKIASMSGG